MSNGYHVGQLVVVRDDPGDSWHCARVVVKRRPRSTSAVFTFIKALEELDE